MVQIRWIPSNGKSCWCFLSESPNSFFDECDSRWNHESRQNRCWPIFNSSSAWCSDVRTFRVKPHSPYLIQFPEKKQSDIIFDGSASPSKCRQSLEEIRERLEDLDHIWKHLISFIPTNLTRLAFRANFCGFLVSPSKLIWKKKAKLLFDTLILLALLALLVLLGDTRNTPQKTFAHQAHQVFEELRDLLL